MANNKTNRYSHLSRSLIWMAFYVFIVLLPLLLLIVGDAPPGTSYLWDFSIGLGVGAASLILMMAILTARFVYITAPFGIDVLYYFHRLIAFLILILVIAHPAILFGIEPLLVYMFEPPTAFSMIAGLISFVSIVILVITSVRRRWFSISYDTWRRIHIIFGALALIFAFFHMASIDYYTGVTGQFILWSVYAVVWLVILFYVRLYKPFKLLSHPYKIDELIKERGNSWSIMVSPVGHSCLQFMPGQFVWLSTNSSPFALADHPFSISTSAEKTEQIGFTIKELGDFSSTIKYLKPGQHVYVDGPFGVFTYDRYPAQGYVFIAGGIGIVPMMSMLRTMADRQDKRPLTLIYGNKSSEKSIYFDELEAMKSVLNLNVVHVYSAAPYGWQGETGLMDTQLLTRYINGDYKHLHYFICGPAPMIKCVESSLVELDVSYRQIHSEIFNLV